MEETREYKGLKRDLLGNIKFFYEEELEEAFKDIGLIVIAVSSIGIEGVELCAAFKNSYTAIIGIVEGIVIDIITNES